MRGPCGPSSQGALSPGTTNPRPCDTSATAGPLRGQRPPPRSTISSHELKPTEVNVSPAYVIPRKVLRR